MKVKDFYSSHRFKTNNKLTNNFLFSIFDIRKIANVFLIQFEYLNVNNNSSGKPNNILYLLIPKF